MGAPRELEGMTVGLVLTLLFMVCLGYALALQTRRGRLLATRRTWLVVVIGVALVLAALALMLPWEHLLLTCGSFAVAGAPMIARSIYNELRDEADATRRVRE